MTRYNLRVVIIPEEEGGYSAIATKLPGCCSHGETIEEAIENIKEAFVGVAKSYLKKYGYIPWNIYDDIPMEKKLELRCLAVEVDDE
jgi:predicted RNase H-like HicB family nuclease